MKSFQLSLVFTVFIGLNSGMAVDTPIIEQRFNDHGNMELVNGAQLGKPGSGVSGQQDDRAYAATGFDLGDALQPAAVLEDMTPSDDLEEITVTVWYKIGAPPVNATSLVNLRGVYLLWQGEATGGWTMRLDMSDKEDMRSWFNPNKPASILAWNAEDQWIFYAFTWDRSAGEATVYQGTPQDAVVEQRRWATSEVFSPSNNTLYLRAPVAIGNNVNRRSKKPGMRAFDGHIDNVRVFGRALSVEDLEQVRAADATNRPL
jgi:hypothetical protein